MNRNSLEATVSDALAPERSVKKKDHWYLDKSDIIWIVNLQKSDFGGKFYINVGLFIKPDITTVDEFAASRLKERDEDLKQYYDYSKQYALGQFPKEHHCDIRARLDALVPDREGLNVVLNLEDSSVTDRQRVITISQAIRDYALPLVFSDRQR
jgi:hypothetical protein